MFADWPLRETDYPLRVMSDLIGKVNNLLKNWLSEKMDSKSQTEPGFLTPMAVPALSRASYSDSLNSDKNSPSHDENADFPISKPADNIKNPNVVDRQITLVNRSAE